MEFQDPQILNHSNPSLLDNDAHIDNLAQKPINEDNALNQKEKTNTNTDFVPDCPKSREYVEVIKELRALQGSDRSAERKINKLLKMTPYLTMPNVGRWIRQNPGYIEDVLAQALKRSNLDDQ